MILEQLSLFHTARNSIEYHNVDVWLKHVQVGTGIDLDFKIAYRQLIRNQLSFPGLRDKLLPDRRPCVHRSKSVSHRKMINPRNRTENFSLSPFTAAGCSDENEGFIFFRVLASHREIVEDELHYRIQDKRVT